MDPDHNSAAPEVCPACGAPYPASAGGAGCPVCLLQGALGLDVASEDGLANEALARLDEGRFDHYALVRRGDGTFEELGRGAMGITYRATDTVLGHAVALKALDPRVATHPQARERFLREARAAARLRHPHVASIHYYGVRKGDGQCFYAMELVEGESVEARVRRTGPLPVPLSLEIVTQVARALGAAEAQGLVHRDLKPANLMLVDGPEPTVKVIDFGLAKAVTDTASEADLTQGGFVGTPAFASPEQCAGTGVDSRSDLYSLGITLWTMLTGQAPFRGSPAEVRQQHLEAPVPLDQLHGVAQPVVALLEALLAKDPARRLQAPAQLLTAVPKVRGALKAGRSLRLEDLHKKAAAASGTGTHRPRAAQGLKQISIARLPVTGKDVFGREEDLTFLDRAWADPRVNVVTIVAWGGVGKSTLVNHWLRRLAAEGYRGAQRVFGWSFYRQGTSGEASSADEFLDTALAWFGDLDPRLGTAWQKGERLARLIARRRTLLVLDGLEPLQNPPGPHEGRLREPALQALLRELAALNRGLCVVTTRLPVADLTDQGAVSAPRLELDHLSHEAGVQLLRALGVRGPETELQAASEEFSGHCLALTLLGSYLADAYEGNTHNREEVLGHLAHDVRQGVHARKVMAAYQSWFGEGPELETLRLLGLFDRPADVRAVAALLKPPAIPGLTECLADLSPGEWRTILAKLRRARLLTGEDPRQPGQLDAHPLVREYFGEQLRGERSPAWREGNRRLYGHYRALAPPLPGNFREMEPLFLAVACGCQAGLLHDALQDVYVPRIQRGDAFFAANVLGVRGALVSVLAHFFPDRRWGSLAQTDVAGQSLTPEDQLSILMQAGMYLTATRGLASPEMRICYERAEPLCQALNRPVQLYVALMGQWRFFMNTGPLAVPMRIAQRIYSLAQRQNSVAPRVGAQLCLALPLYFSGDFEGARRHLKQGLRTWSLGDVPSAAEEVDAPAVSLLCYEALCQWHFGEMASSQANLAKAISLANELNDPHALAVALQHAAGLGCYHHRAAEVERCATELIELSTRHHFPYFLALATIYRGWARSASGDTAEGMACLERGILDYPATGSLLGMPQLLSLKAEALHVQSRFAEALEAIRAAEALAESLGAGWHRAELYRLRGVSSAALGADEAQVEAVFREAVHTAQQQKSTSLLKRGEASYAEYRSRKGN